MAPPKKPAGTTQARGAPRRPPITLAPVPADSPATAPPLPNPPGGLLAATKARWADFWSSPSAQATENVDLVVAERWLLAYDEHRRALNAFRRKRLVEGSTGQPVLNPLATWVASREAAMHKAEAQLGIGTKARVDLGISVGQAKLTAAQLNRMAEEDDDLGPEDDATATLLEEFDPAPPGPDEGA